MAFLLTPREWFVRKYNLDKTYANTAIPIGYGQTISGPELGAHMTDSLDPQPNQRVLEIGTGSGYQTAVLARLCRRVYTVERHRHLLQEAETRFRELGLHNITSRVGDGHTGWPEQAPFDRIIVTAAAETVPQALVDQLADGGILLLPLGLHHGAQEIVKLTKSQTGLTREVLLPVRFVPLLPGQAKEL